DPRTKKQRRVDAIEAISSGADHLQCQCGNPDCPNKDAVAAPFVIHVVNGPAEHPDTEAQPGEPAESAETAAESAEAEADNESTDEPEPADDPADADSVATLVHNDGILPPEQIANLAEHATIRPLIHPGDAGPEPRYTPSRKLAEFVRCRDMGCRFPGCDVAAWKADIDHTIPYSQGGPTQASNLKCLCRLHHLIKTFWGWRDQQHRDGTVIWTSPAGQTYTTRPGSAVLFPSLCAPAAAVIRRDTHDDPSGERTTATHPSPEQSRPHCRRTPTEPRTPRSPPPRPPTSTRRTVRPQATTATRRRTTTLLAGAVTTPR
ncbi:HNH endonuclease signature motif containing protein, partial [[Mycobacterium] manitobense]|uniref:HNH endonuclease signature motif containing protein n=1 Tax=[Mycobacterium] manitobense TaxID=190147 RepID=UPI0021F2FA8A